MNNFGTIQPRLSLTHFPGLVGDGEDAPRMRARAESSELSNVQFVGWLPRAQVVDVLERSDACILHLQQMEMMKWVRPTKMFEAMFCRLPILTNMSGEGRDTLLQADCGYFFESGNYESFKKAVLDMKRDTTTFEKKRANARDYVLTHYNRATIVRDLHGRLVDTTST